MNTRCKLPEGPGALTSVAIDRPLGNAGTWARVGWPIGLGGVMSLIRETVGHIRDLPRYRQILSSLVRYGYQDVVAALHLEGSFGRSNGSRWATTSPRRTGRAGFGWFARTWARPSSSWGNCSVPGRICCRRRTPTSWRRCGMMCGRSHSPRSRRS